MKYEFYNSRFTTNGSYQHSWIIYSLLGHQATAALANDEPPNHFHTRLPDLLENLENDGMGKDTNTDELLDKEQVEWICY